MTTTLPEKPKRGRPKAGTDDAVAVAFMESEVIRLRRDECLSFPEIDARLHITNSDRIFRRAAEKVRAQSRDDAYALESLRLDALHRKAWGALEDDGLDPLAERVAKILAESYEIDEWDGVPERVRSMIERAYADTYRGIPVALGVHNARAKLDGLTHGDRIADARLELDQATVQVWAGALVTALGLLDVPVADKRAVVERWGEIVAGQVESDEP